MTPRVSVVLVTYNRAELLALAVEDLLGQTYRDFELLICDDESTDDTPAVADSSLLHFKRIAARAMRQVLVEAARRRNADKRGGGAAVVTFDDAMSSLTTADDVLGLDAALEALAAIAPRQAQMVESRFFGGLDVAETATLLGVSEATVMRLWRYARAWLWRELRAGEVPS
jgi:RNA polymerase sigma factor (TIGR02999 family)